MKAKENKLTFFKRIVEGLKYIFTGELPIGVQETIHSFLKKEEVLINEMSRDEWEGITENRSFNLILENNVNFMTSCCLRGYISAKGFFHQSTALEWHKEFCSEKVKPDNLGKHKH